MKVILAGLVLAMLGDQAQCIHMRGMHRLIHSDDHEADMVNGRYQTIAETDSSMEKMSSELAKHVTIDGAPKTEYQLEQEHLTNSTDKLTKNWIQRLDDMDPTLSQEMTS